MKATHTKKLYFGSTLILLFVSLLNSASIYYEKPSSARLAAASHTPPACNYQNKKYAHGQQVTTPEPCLNCTCKKGVLLCFLRVCPTLLQLSPHDNCKTVRESGQCCPKLDCETPSLTTVETSPTIISSTQSALESTQTTAKHENFTKLLESTTFWNNEKVEATTIKSELINISSYNLKLSTEKPESIPTTAKQLLTENVTLHYSHVLQNNDKIDTEKTKFLNNQIDNRITITQKDKTTTIFQTSPSTTFHDSILLVTSSPTSALEEKNENFINIERSCVLNGTIYAEGSAVISTSFCEYCYCIRSKRMCIRPRCHLSIMGCLPRYTSEYACCPTSYVCGEQALTTLPVTTTSSTTSTEAYLLYGRNTACLIDGIEYRVGEPIPSDQHCKPCFCSTGGIKKCRKIQCSSEMEGCVPIIPEGHCCPVEYKCNSTQTVTEISRTTISQILKQTTFQNINENTTYATDLFLNSDETEITTEAIKDSVVNSELFSTQISEKFSNADNYSNIETTTSLNIFSHPNDDENKIDLKIISNDSINDKLGREDTIYENEDSLLPSEQIDLTQRSSDTKHDLFETTTNILVSENIKYDSNLKTESYLEKDTTNTNTEFNANNNLSNAQIELTTIDSVLESIDSSSYKSLNSSESLILENQMNGTTLPSNISVITLNENENNSSNESTNATTYEKVEYLLQGIIHAIDQHLLHRRIPAETRIQDNDSTENLLSKKVNDQEMLKPVSSRREVNAGVSSTLLISDDPDSQPYKSNFNSDSESVEIITAKTAFYDMHENSGDSILISLTPSSLKVGSSPITNTNPFNVKHTQTLAQNNRSPIYGKPALNSYSNHMMPSNDWRIVSSNFPRRPQFEDAFAHSESSKSSDSLYYINSNNNNNDNIRRHDSDETFEEIDKELDKRSRLEDSSNDPTRMKVIPFKIKDGFAGLSQKRKNGSFIIRLPTPPKNISPDSKTTQQISCMHNSQEYSNGAMIPKSDPCNLCRCFYGRELCQEQKCPTPPEKDCVPEKLAGYCCPRYICRVTEDSKLSQNTNMTSPQLNGLSFQTTEISSASPIRKSPQFPSTVKTIINITNSSYDSNKNEESIADILPQNMNHFDDKSSKEETEKYYQSIPEFPAVPSHVHELQNRYPPFPLDPTPKTYHRNPTHNTNNKVQSGNRIHFPTNNMNEKEQNGSQPPRSESISALIPPLPQSSQPFISGPIQVPYNGGNKFRLKPSLNVNQQQAQPQPQLPQRPNLRLPPFLLHSMPNTQLSVNNNLRQKQNGVQVSESSSTKPITSEISSHDFYSTMNVKISNSTSNNLANKSKIATSTRSTPKIANPQSIKNINLMFDSVMSSTTPRITKVMTTTMTPSTTMPSTISSIPTSSSSKTTLSVGNDSQNNNKVVDSWDLFKVSGCNIYGTMYQIDQHISQLSTTCKKCICSPQGVKCNNIC